MLVKHFELQLGVQIIEICLATRERNGGKLYVYSISLSLSLSFLSSVICTNV